MNLVHPRCASTWVSIMTKGETTPTCLLQLSHLALIQGKQPDCNGVGGTRGKRKVAVFGQPCWQSASRQPYRMRQISQHHLSQTPPRSHAPKIEIRLATPIRRTKRSWTVPSYNMLHQRSTAHACPHQQQNRLNLSVGNVYVAMACFAMP